MPIFLLTDIEGSTQLWQRSGEAMGRALAQHDELIRSCLESHHGRFLKHTGDGVLAIFEPEGPAGEPANQPATGVGNGSSEGSARHATNGSSKSLAEGVAIDSPTTFSESASRTANGCDPLGCALAVQSAMAAARWDLAEPLWVRVALHAGDAEIRQVAAGHTDYFGLTITRLARLISAAWGGQILVTPGVLAGSPLPEGAVLRDQGVHTLKDLYEPQRIFQVTADYLPEREHQPLRTLSARTTNLQAQATPFVGRDSELQQIAELLAEPDCRLLTIVGPGGMGKSRLAVQAAAEAVDLFADGAYSVPLEPVMAPDLVPAAIAEALGLRLPAQGDRVHALASQIGERQALVVLDGIEHLLESDASGQAAVGRASHETTAMLLQLLAGAPHVKFLVTSRRRLNVQSEWLLRLEGLQFAAADLDPDTTPVPSEAMALFVQSARRAKPDFHPSPEDEAAIAQIGTLLGGMPLGLELAAAWVRHLRPAEIAATIGHDESFLAAGEQDRAERQRSLATVFDYAWEHLHSGEQVILARLAIFEEPFRHSAAEQVATASLAQLLALVDKSVLLRTPAGRYALHPLWREYVRRKAEESGNWSRTKAPASDRPEREVPADSGSTEHDASSAGDQPVSYDGAAAVDPLRRRAPGAEQSQATGGGLSGPDQSGDIASSSGGGTQLTGGVATNPYKGLRPFEAADAASFYGREALTETLLARLGEPGAEGRFLAVVGPSGSGKSSVVKAGLLPQLKAGALPGSDRWRVVQLTPGKYPVDELAIALQWALGSRETDLIGTLRRDERGLLQVAERLLADDAGSELVVVLDQFEELFTLCEDDAVRQFVMDSVLVGVRDPASRLRVVVTLRADFLDRPLQYGGFGELLRERTSMVVPLTPAELEQAIVEPAQAAGVATDLDLVATVIADVSEEVGALPLLQYALYALFDRREDGRLTLEAYRRLGGVSGAMAGRADALYEPQDEAGREATRQLFLRLVTLGEGSEDTRRRTSQAELDSVATDRAAMHRAIHAYAEHRLLTLDRDPVTGGPTIEVAHEAIIREWGRLRAWLDESREDLRLQRGLARGADEWAASGRDASYLVRGSRLTQLETWVAGTTVALTAEERAYLEASTAARRQREDAEAKRAANERALEKRSKHRLRVAVGVLAAGVVVALGLSGVALAARQKSAAEAVRSSRLAQVATVGELLAKRQTDQALALGLEAVAGADDLPEAELALADAAYAPGTRLRLTAPITPTEFWSMALSPDGKLLVSGSKDHLVRLWDAETGKLLRELQGHTDNIYAIAFTPDGKQVLSGSGDNTLILWDVATGELIRRLEGHTGAVEGLAISPDGKQALTGSDDTTVRLWDLATGRQLKLLQAHNSSVRAVAITPDGRTALTGDWYNGEVVVWELASGREVRRLRGHRSGVWELAISPDGRFVAGGGHSGDPTIRIWEIASGAELRVLRGFSSAITALAYSADGRFLISGAGDTILRVWDAQTGLELQRYTGHRTVVHDAAFSPDLRTLYSASEDGSLRIWNRESGAQRLRVDAGEANEKYYVASYSPDGRRVAVAGYRVDVHVLDAQTGQVLLRLPGHVGTVQGLAYSPDGRTLATSDNTLRLWDSLTGRQLWCANGHTAAMGALAFSPDGRLIISVSGDQSMRLWDTATGRPLARMALGGTAYRLAITPDGRRAVVAVNKTDAEGHDVLVWDLATRRLVYRLGGHTGIVTGVDVSPDGRIAASGGYDRQLILWDLATGTEADRAELPTLIQTVAFSPDGRDILLGMGDGSVLMWNRARRAVTRRYLGGSQVVAGLAFRPDGRGAVSATTDGTIQFWDLHPTRDDLLGWIGGQRYQAALTCGERVLFGTRDRCSPDGTPPAAPALPMVAATQIQPTPPALVQADSSAAAAPLSDAALPPSAEAPITTSSTVDLDALEGVTVVLGVELARLEGHLEPVTDVRFGADGNTVVSSAGVSSGSMELDRPSDDNSVRVWDVAAGRERLRITGHGNAVLTADLSPDGRWIASGSRDLTVALWDASNGKNRWRKGMSASVQSVRFSPDGKVLAVGAANKVLRLLDAANGQVLHRLEGHTDGISDVDFSPDGRRLASTSPDRFVKVWDTATGEAISSLGGGIAGHTDFATGVAFSPDGAMLASGGDDGVVILWDVDAEREVRRLVGHREKVKGVAFSPDSRFVLSVGTDRTARLWDVASGSEVRRFRVDARARAAFSPDGTRIVTGGQDGRVVVWDSGLAAGDAALAHDASRSPVSKAEVDAASGEAMAAHIGSQAGSLAVGHGDDWSLHIPAHSVVDVAVVANTPATGPVTATQAITPGRLDPALLVRAADGSVLAANDDVQGEQDPNSRVEELAFDAAADIKVEVRAADPRMSGSYALVVTTTRLVRPALTAGDGPGLFPSTASVPRRVAVAPDGSAALVGFGRMGGLPPAKENQVVLWSLVDGRRQLTLNADGRAHQDAVNAVAISPDGRQALSGSADNELVLWDLATGRELRRLGERYSGTQAAIFGPDGQQALSANGVLILLWDLATGTIQREMELLTDTASALALAADGKSAVAGTVDGSVFVWDLATGEPTQQLVGSGSSINDIALAPDGRRVLAAQNDASLVLWNLAEARVERRFTGHGARVWAAAISPDGQLGASGSADHTVRLWDLATGAEVARLVGHTDDVRDVAFTPDGRRLVSVGFDGTLRVWEVAGVVER